MRAMDTKKDFMRLRGRLKEMLQLRSAIALASWDQEVYMPPAAAESRAAMMAYLSGEYHQKLLALDEGGLLSALDTARAKDALKPKEAAIVRELVRDHSLAAKLPMPFVVEFAEVTSRAQHVWREAKGKDDFALFRPWLERIVKLSREKAKLLGGPKPYDALVDTYEPGMTSDELSITFEELKAGLVPLVAKIRDRRMRPANAPKGTFPVPDQKRFLDFICARVGFDADSGRLDTATHPFENAIGPSDVRITTRYSETDLWQSIGSVIHELGHAMYEQGLPAQEAGTPLCEAVSLAVHESQSRFWENMVGRDKNTWRFFYPELKKRFPQSFKDYDLDEWHRYLHVVKPSLIRTESDEVTYNLHIILRFELEKELIEGTIRVKDLPEIWDQKMQEYLGVRVPDDTRGVLQDVHWSCGMIGYFPTYTLGNLYSAQLNEAIRCDMPDFGKKLAKGEFLPIRGWLREKIHRHGRFYPASELMRRATGSPLAVEPFLTYLTEKYSEIYHL